MSLDLLSILQVYPPFGQEVTPVMFVIDYIFVGPATATVGAASDWFTVTLGPGVLSDPVSITPDDSGAGGTFSVASVVLTNAVRSAQFTYTPAGPGTIILSVTNDDSLTDPPSLILIVSAGSGGGGGDDFRGHEPIVELKPARTKWYVH